MFKKAILCIPFLPLSACASVNSAIDSTTSLFTSDDANYCPDVAILSDASSITNFQDNITNMENLNFHASMSLADGSCIIDDNNVSVDFSITITAQKGAAIPSPRAETDYFIAVIDYNGLIIKRDSFPANIIFSSEENTSTLTANIGQNISIAPNHTAEDYKIITGFELTREEAAYNRR